MIQDDLKVKGFYHVQIVDDPDGEAKVVGDSGWIQNQVTNLGFNDYLVQLLGDMAGSKQVTHMALGAGTAPGAADTALQSEVEVRQSVTAATSSSSKTLRLTATFNSALSFVTDTQTLQNIGLFNTSAQTTGTIFAGNTFATSTCAVNQAVCNKRQWLATVIEKLREFGGSLFEIIPSQARSLVLLGVCRDYGRSVLSYA